MTTSAKIICKIAAMVMTVLITGGCADHDHKKIKTNISGSFPGFPNKMIVLHEFDINSTIPLDTARIDENGNFSFHFKRSGPGFYLLKIDNKNYITLSLNKEKNVEVSSAGDNIKKNYSVKGSDESELLCRFESDLENNRLIVDSLTRLYRDFQRSASFSSLKTDLDKNYHKIYESQRQNSIGFIKTNCQSLVSLLVINKRFGQRKIITEEDDFEIYQLLDSCLSLTYPENKFVKELKKQVNIISNDRKVKEMTAKRLDVGQKIPDIILLDPAGKNISLYSMAGHPVLLYFWASWDKTSRKANETIKTLAMNNDAGSVSVYAIGFEKHLNDWKQAIDIDGLQNWTHVSDMLNIHSIARTMYDVPEDLPYFFLLDKDLLIRYKGNNTFDLQRALDSLAK